MTFHKNPSGGSRVVSCGRTDRCTVRANMTKITVAFRNFTYAPKSALNYDHSTIFLHGLQLYIHFLCYICFVDSSMCVRGVGNVFQCSGAQLILLLVDASSQRLCFPAVLLTDRQKVC